MALHYLSGIINKEKINTNMEDIGLIYPDVEMGKPLTRIRLKAQKMTKKRAQQILNYNLRVYKALKRKLLKVTNPKERAILEKQIARQENFIKKRFPMANLGKAKKKKFTKPQLIKKIKAATKKAIERRKNDKHSPKEKAAHMIAKQAFAVPRGAFLGIMLLGKALEKTPIKINIAKRLKEKWGTKKKQILETWYKLGGEPDILTRQIEKATKSKLSGELGYVVAASTGASIAAASPIIVKLLNIVGKGVDFAKKNPKLIAAGKSLLKKGIEQTAKKKGKTGALNEVSDTVESVTENLPPSVQEKIAKVQELLPEKVVNEVGTKAENEVQATKESIQAESGQPTTEQVKEQISEQQATQNGDTETGLSNTAKIGIGAGVLVGAYLLTKK